MAQVPQPTSAMQPVLRALRLPHLGAGSKIAALVLAVIVVLTLLAGWIAPHDPLAMNPMARLQGPIEGHPLGTDNFGRDIFSRVLIGGQLSLIIGIATAVVSVLLGLIIGMIAGFFRTADAIIMRALVALNGPSVGSVIAAITIPEIPRVVRLVRAVVLSAREEPYVEAAIALGTPMRKILVRHLVPNTTAPLIVQGTYILASAILTEAILSFLGAGVSTETPTWGNIMAEGRLFFRIKPELILYPGIALSLCILSINLLGDAARDMLDPRLKKRAG